MQAFQLRIDIKGTKPPVWRRVRVPANATFAQLHTIIQNVFGWDDCHLYDFKLKDCTITTMSTDDYIFFADEELNAENVRLIEKLSEGMKFTYTYDFGDNWEHSIKVEKIIEQEEAYPVLMKWAQDNLCEDIGGVYGYYTKMECMKDSTNPDAQDLRAWFEEGYNPFDAQNIQRQLCKMLISEESDEDNDEFSLEEFYDDLENILMYVEDGKTAIIKLICEDDTFYVRAHEGDKGFIQIFANKEDCSFASLHQLYPADPYHLYVEGICIDFPNDDDMDEIMDDENAWYPTIYYHERGVGVRETTDEEFAKICTFLDEFGLLCRLLSPEYMLPSLETDKRMAKLVVDGQEGSLREIAPDFEDTLIPVTCTPEEMKVLAKANKTKDIVCLSIAPIENLFDERDARDIVYYLLFHSTKQQDYQHIETMDYEFMSPLLKKLLLSYIREHGRPKTICCEDGHIKDMIQPFCDVLKIKLRCKKMDKEPFMEEYSQAFEEQNPLHLLDRDFMQKIVEQNEDFLQEIIEGNDEAKKRKLEKYMNFLEIFSMKNH